MLHVTDLYLRRGETLVLAGGTLRVAPGEIVWIQGASGSGKSSLLRALAGLLPCEGSIQLDGVQQRSLPAHQWRARVALAPSPAVPLGDTVGEDLLAPFRLQVRRGATAPRPEHLLAELRGVGLGQLDLLYPSRELSQGQLARIAFLRTALAAPQVLLLDEPTANLDAAAGEAVAERVRAYAAQGGSALVCGHTTPWAGTTRRFHLGNTRLLERAS